MITSGNIKWLAGLLEAEATFLQMQTAGPSIRLVMGDQDVVVRAAALLGGAAAKETNHHGHAAKPHWKPMFRTQIAGWRAASWMMTLYSELGIRRRAKIRKLLTTWKARPCYGASKPQAVWKRA